MSRINTNIPALQAIYHLNRNHADLSRALERLSTGLRINSGVDDPAGLIHSEHLRFEMRGLSQAIENSARASNVISTAEGAINEVSKLLLDVQALVVQAANTSGLSSEEIAANQLQIDSILDSIDRIAQTTSFAGRKLMDGSQGYYLSTPETDALASVSVFAARPAGGFPRNVTVRVTQSAQTGTISFVGSQIGSPVTTSATTLQIKGTIGSELVSFVAGTTLVEIRDTINSLKSITGVSAVVSTPSTGSVASALRLDSTDVGSDAFVSVEPLLGNFIVNGNSNQTIRDNGVDAGVLVDGQLAEVKGLRADVRSLGLDARVYLTKKFGQTLSSATFTITGGGAVYQLTPEISPNGQINVGLQSVSTSQLGNAVVGRLFSLRTGGANSLEGGNLSTAQNIVEEAVSQVAVYRGRLGNIQRNQIQPNINSQTVTLENVTAAESSIRDAEIAVEVSQLTRAQVLVQSTQNTLRIANSIPQLVLSLLA